jgi:hypothetical protein
VSIANIRGVAIAYEDNGQGIPLVFIHGHPFNRTIMSLSQALLPEFDREMAYARKTLERVPEDRFDWKPHEKSPAMGWLATHIASLPLWANYTIERDELDTAPGGVKLAPCPHPSPRPTWGLPASQRRAGTFDLRPLGRRRPDASIVGAR